MKSTPNDEHSKYPRKDKTRIDDQTLWRINDHIIEVVVDEGVDGSVSHVIELFNTVSEMTPSPTAILINRENDYSVDLGILWEIRKGTPFEYVAIANHGRLNQYIPTRLWPKFMKLSFFNGRADALDWLHEKLQSK